MFMHQLLPDIILYLKHAFNDIKSFAKKKKRSETDIAFILTE